MLWFFKYFRKNNRQKIGVFDSKIFKISITTLVFEKNANFVAENSRKSRSIVTITTTPASRVFFILGLKFLDVKVHWEHVFPRLLCRWTFSFFVVSEEFRTKALQSGLPDFILVQHTKTEKIPNDEKIFKIYQMTLKSTKYTKLPKKQTKWQ
jgi:hypothetical protein